MKSLKTYIYEEKDEITSNIKKADIKFTIWESPEKKVKWLKDNESYQKIEYKLIDKKDFIEIDFLLGFKDGSWHMWAGKIGSSSYDDEPYCDFKTEKFAECIIQALDKIKEFVDKIKDDPENYVQFYTNR